MALSREVGPTFTWHMYQPHMMSYNLTAEQQLPGQMALTVAYAGSRGINLFNWILEANPIVPTGVPSANGTRVSAFPGPRARPHFDKRGDEGIDKSGGRIGDLLLPGQSASPRNNLNFGSVPYYVSNGDSIYNSLQTNLVKRISHGLQLQTAFTWGKVDR